MTFSIVIPVYNVAPYLRESLDSVLAQTFTDWEAICVDDGSTDASGAILDAYAAKDARFKVIHQSNGGVSAARNVALEKVQGDWVGFADPDDVLHRDWLSNFKQLIDSHDVDIVRGAYTLWDGSRPLPEVDGCGGGHPPLVGRRRAFQRRGNRLEGWLCGLECHSQEPCGRPSVSECPGDGRLSFQFVRDAQGEGGGDHRLSGVLLSSQTG